MQDGRKFRVNLGIIIAGDKVGTYSDWEHPNYHHYYNILVLLIIVILISTA